MVVLLCRYKSSPQEVAVSCDVTFAMLADPESAVRMFHLDFFVAWTAIPVMATYSCSLSGGSCLWKARGCKRNEFRKRVLPLSVTMINVFGTEIISHCS